MLFILFCDSVTHISISVHIYVLHIKLICHSQNYDTMWLINVCSKADKMGSLI